MPLFKDNRVDIVGTLVEADIKTGTSKTSGAKYVNGTVQIKTTPADKEMVIELSLMSMEKSSKGNVLKNFEFFQTLPSLIGKRVSVTASIEENKFWSATSNTLVKTPKLRVNFINLQQAGETLKDTATFTIGGFVARPLVEISDRDGNLVGYELTLGQANYKEDMATFIPLRVDPRNNAAVTYIQSQYLKGDTVRLNGILNFKSETITKTEKADFGPDVVKTYQKNIKEYLIESGAKISDETIYDNATIEKLTNAATADDERVQAEAKNRPASTPTQGAGTQAPTNRALVL